MTAFDDLDRHLEAFLLEGPTDLPDPSFDAIRDSIDRTRQRVVYGPWRSPDMNKFAAMGLGAAAVVVAVLVGAQLLGPTTPSGIGVPPSASPTTAPTTSPSASGPAAGGLPLGAHPLLGPSPGVPVTVTIPASGWEGDPGAGIITKGTSDPPGGAGMIVFNDLSELYVPSDPCHWQESLPATGSKTADELVAALTAQTGRDASAPTDIEIDGHAGKSIVLHVPDDAVVASCDLREYCTLANPTVNASDACMRYAQGPGQIDTLYIVPVDGKLVVIDTATYAGTPAGVVAEIERIATSATFE